MATLDGLLRLMGNVVLTQLRFKSELKLFLCIKNQFHIYYYIKT